MSSSQNVTSPVDQYTRWLSYGLVGFCSVAILFGPQIAEAGLRALACPGGFGQAGMGCSGVSGLIAGRLTPWLEAVPPVETSFVLIEKFWDLLALWIGLIVLSRWQALRTSRTPESVTQRELLQQPPPQPQRRTQQARWVQIKQAEQYLEQQSLTRQLSAKGPFWGAVGLSWWALLGGLIAFAIVFGTPFFVGLNADALLQNLGCSRLGCESEFGDYWSTRLAPYQLPLYGGLSAPLWLFTQFHDVLLVWLALILALGLLPVYRFDWWTVVNQRMGPLVWGLFAVFLVAAATLVCTVIFGDLAPLPKPRSGDLGAGILFPIFVMHVLFVPACVLFVALISFIVLVIVLKRRLAAKKD